MDLDYESLLEQARKKREQELIEEQTREKQEAQTWLTRYLQGRCTFEQLPEHIRIKLGVSAYKSLRLGQWE